MRIVCCPVCGMDTSGSEITSDHLGISYHFCSQQCLQNFSSHPKIYLGIKSEKQKGKSVIKKRSFVLGSSIPRSDANTLEDALSEMMGIREVQISGEKVSITYDLLEVTAMQIEQVLEKEGIKLGSGWSDRLKRGWIQYTEENELNILSSTDSACCNRPPRHE